MYFAYFVCCVHTDLFALIFVVNGLKVLLNGALQVYLYYGSYNLETSLKKNLNLLMHLCEYLILVSSDNQS